MSVLQWQDWQAYMELAPFVEERDDMRTARIVATIANIVRDTETQPEPYTTIDFVQRFGDTPEMFDPAPTRTQTASDFGEVMRALADAYTKGVK